MRDRSQLSVPPAARHGRDVTGDVGPGQTTMHRVPYATEGSQNNVDIRWTGQGSDGPQLAVSATRIGCERAIASDAARSGAAREPIVVLMRPFTSASRPAGQGLECRILQCATLSHMKTIGARELRQRASEHLKTIEAGGTFEITPHGRPVTLLVQAGEPAGSADGAGRRTPACGSLLDLGAPVKPRAGTQTPTEALAAARAAER